MTQPVKYPLNKQAIGQVSNLQRLWEAGGFAITVQLPPFLGADPGDFVAQVTAQAHPFDAVLALDAPGGAIGLSSLATAVLLKRVGIETIVHFSGRDRNRLALQSDILSQGALGITNLLIDMRPILRSSLVQNADARLVTDLDGSALLATAVQLRDEARFISGASIKIPPALYIGAYFSVEESIQVKTIAHAQFVVTLPIDDVQAFGAALSAFQTSYPDFLQTRPLLVSLPLITNSTVENADAVGDVREAGIQKIISSIEVLKSLDSVRGVNIVVSELTDLTFLEQIIDGAGAGERLRHASRHKDPLISPQQARSTPYHPRPYGDPGDL